MKIWIVEYELFPPWPGSFASPRRGALLKIEDPECGFGFADCHPWVERGDLPLPKQLNLLMRGKLTPLTERSLFFARLDAVARSEQRWLFVGAAMPKSHWLVPAGRQEFLPCWEAGRALGFETFKVKVGTESEASAAFLNAVMRGQEQPLHLRIDGNYKLNPELLRIFLASLDEEVVQAIEFIEDPFPYDAGLWSSLSRDVGICIARDEGSNPADVDDAAISVIKPAIQNPMPMVTVAAKLHKKIVITSYLDHPLGQATAAYAAALACKHAPETVLRCGLISHPVYAANAFSERLAISDERLVPAAGTGFGFDDELAALEWTRLI